MSIKQLIPANGTTAVVVEDGRIIRLKVICFGLCKDDVDGESVDIVSPFVYIPDLNRLDRIDDYEEYCGLELDGHSAPDEEWLKRHEELKAEEGPEEQTEGQEQSEESTTEQQTEPYAKPDGPQTYDQETQEPEAAEPEPDDTPITY